MTGDGIKRSVDGARPAHGMAIAPVDDPALDRELSRLPMNDLGNAERLIRRFGRDLMHVQDVGWHAWTGTHWDKDSGEGAAQRMAHRTAELILAEVAAIEPELGEKATDVRDLKDALWKWARASGNTPRIRGMLEVTAPKLMRSRVELDADPWLLNVKNGTIELTPPDRPLLGDIDPVQIRAQRRDDLITHMAPVVFEADADADRKSVV